MFFIVFIFVDVILFVSGWLDDIGLPQYKDQFYEARIDGRLLHNLTVVSQAILLDFCSNAFLAYICKNYELFFI